MSAARKRTKGTSAKPSAQVLAFKPRLTRAGAGHLIHPVDRLRAAIAEIGRLSVDATEADIAEARARLGGASRYAMQILTGGHDSHEVDCPMTLLAELARMMPDVAHAWCRISHRRPAEVIDLSAVRTALRVRDRRAEKRAIAGVPQ